MTDHEKSIYIIDMFGISAEKIAEIVGKSQSTVYDKLRQRKSNKFITDDFNKLKSYCLSSLKSISEL
ncbi:hypothetical protein SAMN05421768_103674 [Chryseobacterium joostei]|uniref:Helix-turn-helix domain-containing protein n=1 Tax=Chryseobacterium joostei TaxID=112234 RepID=A0A1N7IB12_9FLAO|nr:hypothetical protein [Chryseobacterium joostei]SIS34264.1 hypothetical protein SAMN05421768_103674 [Chryseobacterium joostei]